MTRGRCHAGARRSPLSRWRCSRGCGRPAWSARAQPRRRRQRRRPPRRHHRPRRGDRGPGQRAVPGVIAPAVPEGSADSVVSGASSNGIPSPALAAYQRGAQIIDAADTSCNIPWELIAAIGRVESDHGRYGGNTLTEDGVSKPGIFGIAAERQERHPGHQRHRRRPAGQRHRSTTAPSARCSSSPRPGRSSRSTPTATASATRRTSTTRRWPPRVYLCSGNDNLSTRKGQEAAVFRYNHSQEYVNLVLRIMEAYSQGDYTAVPSGTYGGTSFSPELLLRDQPVLQGGQAAQGQGRRPPGSSRPPTAAPAAAAARAHRRRHHRRHRRHWLPGGWHRRRRHRRRWRPVDDVGERSMAWSAV